MAKKTGTVKKKVVKVGALGNVYVHSTFNNVIITITNEVGDVISWSSASRRKAASICGWAAYRCCSSVIVKLMCVKIIRAKLRRK